MKINPKDYIKLFNLKVSVLHCYTEIEERKQMGLDNFSNIQIVYIDGQWYFEKNDLDKYRMSDDEINRVIGMIEERGKEYVSFSEKYIDGGSNKSWKELVEIYKKIIEKYGIYIRIVDIPIYFSYRLSFCISPN